MVAASAAAGEGLARDEGLQKSERSALRSARFGRRGATKAEGGLKSRSLTGGHSAAAPASTAAV